MAKLRKKVKRYGSLLLVIALVAIGFFALSNRRILPNRLSPEALAIANKRDISREVSVEGRVAPLAKSEIYFTSQSKVKELKVGVGSRVNKDDIVAITTLTVSGFERSTNVKSPIGGLVTAVNYKAGDLVAALAPAIVVQNDSQLFVECIVNENDIATVVAEQSAQIIIPAISLTESFKAKVVNVYPAPEANASAVGYFVRLLPTSLPGNVRLGMSVDVEIVTATASNVIAVPDSFIVEKDGKFFVKGVKWLNSEKSDYEIYDIEVKLGLRTDEYTEITTGLSEQTELVSPSFTLKREFSFFGG